ncbi:hypothetical protein NliqN6_5623 [Naganishia liquefaciens]|uniref:Up-regulated during septation protein 1 domain-containing protein n=1 Tax=Naganishia liquefaciens TaxID=104408 RepID=A0A8H3TX53_9TREE|nr:hypothetical protein NliqN6_5623 [Naganishia liquefaciens]
MIPLVPQRSRTSGDGTPVSGGQISKAAFFRTRPSHARNGSLHSLKETPSDDMPSGGERNFSSNQGSSGPRSSDPRPTVQNALLGTMSPPITQGHSPATQYADQYRNSPEESYSMALHGRQNSRKHGSSDSRHIAAAHVDSSSVLKHSSSRASSRLGQSDRAYELAQMSGYGDSSQVNGESANLLMNLLASQAAIDCRGLPVSRWEEVEEWKRELSMLTSRLDQQIAKHQREQKILTAARTLAKLNSHNKRMSKQTADSVTAAEQKVADAEKEMLNLQSREGALRRALMEHQAGALAWEVRRLEKVNQTLEETASRLRKEAEEANEFRHLARQQKDQLKQCDERVVHLESVAADLAAKEEKYLATLDILESEKATWREDRGVLEQQTETLRRENKELSKHADTWSRTKPLLASAFGLSPAGDMTEVAEAAQKLAAAVKRKDEELGILKDEMREVTRGMERELSKVAADRDAYKAKIDEIAKGIASDERSANNKLAEVDKRNNELSKTMERLEKENAEMHAALAIAENQAWNRAASTSGEDTKRLEALQREMDANDVVIENLWMILPTPASRRATGLIDAVTDKIKPNVTFPATDCKAEALRGLCEPAPPTRREDYSGVQETVRRVMTLIEDSKVIIERTIQAGKERELFKNNTTRAQRLIEESQASLLTYQRQVNMLEAKLKKAREESRSGAPESENTALERHLRDVESSKQRLEAELAKQNTMCEQLRLANEHLAHRVDSTPKDFEREMQHLQLQYQKEIADLRERLRGGDEDMDRVRLAEQNQRLQLLDELNSAQEKIDKLNTQLRARGG